LIPQWKLVVAMFDLRRQQAHHMFIRSVGFSKEERCRFKYIQHDIITKDCWVLTHFCSHTIKNGSLLKLYSLFEIFVKFSIPNGTKK